MTPQPISKPTTARTAVTHTGTEASHWMMGAVGPGVRLVVATGGRTVLLGWTGELGRLLSLVKMNG